MRFKFWVTILLAIAIVRFVPTNELSQSSKAQTPVDQKTKETNTASSNNGVSFYCGETVDRETGATIPATLAYVPQRKANVLVVAWKSNYIPQWDAQSRCETVSPKFQSFYEDGRLHYLTTGENNGYEIICAATETNGSCTGEDQLFQVKEGSDPEEVLEGLNGIIEGTSSTPLYQSSGSQSSDEKIYVSIEKLLNTAPAIE